MMTQQQLIELIKSSTYRMQILKEIQRLNIPSVWVAAGAIRNLVWDALHQYENETPLNDVDVIYFDPYQDIRGEKLIETTLKERKPSIHWEVRNQARMHIRNGDPPYKNVGDAMSYWPETATAIGARLNEEDNLELLAPYGIQDLVQLKLRPSPKRGDETLFMDRIRKKRWLDRWPRLRMMT
ncbi:hypothetical protein JOD43_001271 [Pullulanibacillus pueri]|uniref:Nucleotidyltransferase family protein n=1 Tax=Pullulanibacillus pueri TaxID=1437324 RepID=A0A8J3EL43_9BACL|nr:nucleotidyltransferase family protein [Pullulanibacillus pueri]MBM7681104.1 hypothetical protein [Pullulanibacillus pueri]GGH77061.1 hypothetical protein GCM10007096_08400 [Pullulanibacillus pueri]